MSEPDALNALDAAGAMLTPKTNDAGGIGGHPIKLTPDDTPEINASPGAGIPDGNKKDLVDRSADSLPKGPQAPEVDAPPEAADTTQTPVADQSADAAKPAEAGEPGAADAGESATPPEIPEAGASQSAQISSDKGGYIEGSVNVGEGYTLKIPVVKKETLGEINAILSGKGIRPENQVALKSTKMTENFSDIGFVEAETASIGGLITAFQNMAGYVTGNEHNRPKAIKDSNSVPAYARYQTPDLAKIIGAKALVATDKVIRNAEKITEDCGIKRGTDEFISKTLTTWGKFCLFCNKHFRPKVYSGIIEEAMEKYKSSCRKQVAEGILGLCENSEFAIVCPECCIGTNDAKWVRTFNSLLSGPTAALMAMIKGNEGEFSASSLNYCRHQYGEDWVRRAVESFYKNSPKNREYLSQAYEQFCRENNISDHGSESLENLLFDEDLRKLCNERKELIRTALNNPQAKKGDVGWNDATSVIDEQLESKWQAWLEKHTVTHTDGSKTINAGHIRVMVNSEQEDTLKLATIVNGI
jgi:hypothetical protein